MPKATAESFIVMLEGQEGDTYESILRLARNVEALGFGGLFRSDHWLQIVPSPDDEHVEMIASEVLPRVTG